MGNIFNKSRLHNQHGISLSRKKKLPASHEVMSAKLEQARRNRTTSNRMLGKENLFTIGNILSGETLKICIARTKGGIGDVLMTTPLLKAIKQRYPECHLTYATDFKYAGGALKEMLENNPYIDDLIPFQGVRKDRFHLYSDITSVGLSRERKNLPPINRIDMFAEYVGIKLIDPVPTYVVKPEEKAWANTMIKKWTKGKPAKVVTLHVSSVDQRRNWPVKNFQEVVSRITAKYPDVFFIVFDQHKRGSWGLKNSYNASAYDLRSKAALISASHLFLGPDSGLLHIAGALEKDIVSLFGSSHPMARINHYLNAVYVDAKTMCKWCWYGPCALKYSCMTNIKVTDVINAIEKKLIAAKALSVTSEGSVFVGCRKDGNVINPMLKQNILGAIGLTSVSTIDSEYDSTLPHMSDSAIEIIDTSKDMGPLYRTGKRIYYVGATAPDVTAMSTNNLKSAKAVFVPSEYVKEHLFSNIVEAKIKVCPIPIADQTYVQNPYRDKGVLSFGTICVGDVDSQIANLKTLLTSFKAVFEKNINVRLHVLTLKRLEEELLDKLPEDLRLQTMCYECDADLDKFYSLIDCYIETAPYCADMFYSLQALARGLNVITPEHNMNYLPNGLVTKSACKKNQKKVCAYTLAPLKTALEDFKILFDTDTHMEGAIARAKYIKENHSLHNTAMTMISDLE